jgi:hypothetical protein
LWKKLLLNCAAGKDGHLTVPHGGCQLIEVTLGLANEGVGMGHPGFDSAIQLELLSGPTPL